MVKFNLFRFGLYLKLVLFIPFVACEDDKTLYSISQIEWCFSQFENKEILDKQIQLYEKTARGGHIDSMRLLGCAYYQYQDLAEAEKWLERAYLKGDSKVATPLALIYLKEGQLHLSKSWLEHATEQTNELRWIRLAQHLTDFEKMGDIKSFESVQELIKKKIQIEGDHFINSNIRSAVDIISSNYEQCEDPNNLKECSLKDVVESRQYLKTLTQGIVESLVFSTPLYWTYKKALRGIYPHASDTPRSI